MMENANNSIVSAKKLVKDFRIGWHRSLRAVDHVSFELHAGQVLGLLGPNGSGKSTIMKMIMGLVRPTSGMCSVWGKKPDTSEVRKRIGFFPEAPYFYKFLSGRELIVFYAKLCGLHGSMLQESVDKTIERVGLVNAADRKVGQYSKGMLQRLAFAQALVHDPELLILDEPTAGLDPIGAVELVELMRKLSSEGKSLIVCSHNLSEMDVLCDEVIVLLNGKPLAQAVRDRWINNGGLLHFYKAAMEMPGKRDE